MFRTEKWASLHSGQILHLNLPRQDPDELVPQNGKDQEYDSIMAEINGIEDELQDDLSNMEEELK